MEDEFECAIIELKYLVKTLTERVNELEENLSQLQFDIEDEHATVEWLLENTNVVMNPEPEKPDAA